MLIDFRIKSVIEKAISKTGLDLTGLTVLTEVGSANFVVTPLIAASANAQRVIAWTKDTKYGYGDEIISECKLKMQLLGIDEKKIIFRNNERPPVDISQANIITNLGMVRPIDKDFINYMRPESVISYMCEAWEIRESDVDITECKQKNIRVAGTWENHPDLKIFDGCGALAVKLLMEAGFEVYQNRIAVISEDDFGEVAKEFFIKMGADEVEIISPSMATNVNETRWDVVFLADYKTETNYVSDNGILENAKMPIVHLSGNVDVEYARKNGISIYPNENGYSKRMTRTLAHLGPKPVIDLHTAGLKVGEALFKQENCEFAQKIGS